MRVLGLLCVAALLARSISAGKPKKADAWRKLDVDAVSRELEEGDDPELLETEDARMIKEMEKRKTAHLEPPGPDVKLKNSKEWISHNQAMTGPAMMFAKLVDANPDTGKPWEKVELSRVAFKWRELMHTGGLETQVYDVTEEGGRPSLLISTQTGWRGYEIRDFLLKQREILLLEWDQVKYSPQEVDAEGNFRAAKGAKPALTDYFKRQEAVIAGNEMPPPTNEEIAAAAAADVAPAQDSKKEKKKGKKGAAKKGGKGKGKKGSKKAKDGIGKSKADAAKAASPSNEAADATERSEL